MELLIIGGTILSLIIFGILFVKGILDGKKEPPNGINIVYPNTSDLPSMVDEVVPDENSPLNLKVDETLRVLNLRKKLNKIEEERKL